MNIKGHLGKLEAFHQVALEGSFRKAAEKMRLAQPSLSRAVAVLEDQIGAPLFWRIKKRITLTPQGEVLHKYCQELFSGLTNLELKLSAPSDPMTANIHIGTYESIAIYFWPRFLKEFLPRYPTVRFDLTTDRNDALLKRLGSGDLDLVAIVEPPTIEGVTNIELYRDSFRCYISPAALNASRRGRGASRGKRLEAELPPLIYMPDTLSGKRETLGDTLRKLDVTYERRSYFTNSLEAVKHLTREGIGIGILPIRVAQPDVDEGRLVPYASTQGARQAFGHHRVCVCIPNHKARQPVFVTFISSFKQFLKS